MKKITKRFLATMLMVVMLIPTMVIPTQAASIGVRIDSVRQSGSTVKVTVSVTGDTYRPTFELNVISTDSSYIGDRVTSFTDEGSDQYSATWNIPNNTLNGDYSFEVDVTNDTGYTARDYSRYSITGSGTGSTNDGKINTVKVEYNESRDIAYVDISVNIGSTSNFDKAEIAVTDPDKKSLSTSLFNYRNNDQTQIEIDTRNLDAGTYKLRVDTYDRSGRRLDYKEQDFTIGSTKPTISKMTAVNDSTSKDSYELGDKIKISATVTGTGINKIMYEYRVNGKVIADGSTSGNARSPYMVWDTSRTGNLKAGDKVEVHFIAVDSSNRELTEEWISLVFAAKNVSVVLRTISPQYYNESQAVIPIQADITGSYFSETKFVLRNETKDMEIYTGNSFVITDTTSATPKAEIRLPLPGEQVQGSYSITAITYYDGKEVGRDYKTFNILAPVVVDDQPIYRGPGVHIIANGKLVVFADQKPVVVNSRTLVPVRSIFEGFGFKVDFNEATSTATLTDDYNYITITARSDKMYVNGVEMQVEVPAEIMNNRMMLPLRAVIEAAGATIDWYKDTGTAVIDYKR